MEFINCWKEWQTYGSIQELHIYSHGVDGKPEMYNGGTLWWDGGEEGHLNSIPYIPGRDYPKLNFKTNASVYFYGCHIVNSMEKDKIKNYVKAKLKDKVLLLLVAVGWVIILHIAFAYIWGYMHRVECIVSVSGDDLRLEDTVDVLKEDGTYVKTIRCIRKQGGIWIIREYRQYVCTVHGPGVDFHPIIKFFGGRYDSHITFYPELYIYQNGDKWDAAVTYRGYTQYFEDIENNEICIELSDV